MFNLGWLRDQRFSSLLSRWETWWHASRHRAGVVAESSTSGFTGTRCEKQKKHRVSFDHLRP